MRRYTIALITAIMSWTLLPTGFNSKAQTVNTSEPKAEVSPGNTAKPTYKTIGTDAINEQDKENMEIIASWHKDFTETFKNKDTDPINRLLNGDILILRGTSTNYMKNPSMPNNSKFRNDYQKSLEYAFSQPDEIDSEMTDLVIEVNTNRPNVYRTNTSMKWSTPKYKDELLLTMLWDFSTTDYTRAVLLDIKPIE